MQKGWFKEAGVEVEILWFDYVPSMDAYVAGKVDGVCMTNGDALVTASSTLQRTKRRRCSPRERWMPSVRHSRTLGKRLT